MIDNLFVTQQQPGVNIICFFCWPPWWNCRFQSLTDLKVSGFEFCRWREGEHGKTKWWNTESQPWGSTVRCYWLPATIVRPLHCYVSGGVCVTKQQIAATREGKRVNGPNGKEEEEIRTNIITNEGQLRSNSINKELVVAECWYSRF